MVLLQYWKVNHGRDTNLLADAWAYRQACALAKLDAFRIRINAATRNESSLWAALEEVTGKKAQAKFWTRALANAAVRKLGEITHKVSLDALEWDGSLSQVQSHVMRIQVKQFVKDAERYSIDHHRSSLIHPRLLIIKNRSSIMDHRSSIIWHLASNFWLLAPASGCGFQLPATNFQLPVEKFLARYVRFLRK